MVIISKQYLFRIMCHGGKAFASNKMQFKKTWGKDQVTWVPFYDSLSTYYVIVILNALFYLIFIKLYKEGIY